MAPSIPDILKLLPVIGDIRDTDLHRRPEEHVAEISLKSRSLVQCYRAGAARDGERVVPEHELKVGRLAFVLGYQPNKERVVFASERFHSSSGDGDPFWMDIHTVHKSWIESYKIYDPVGKDKR